MLARGQKEHPPGGSPRPPASVPCPLLPCPPQFPQPSLKGAKAARGPAPPPAGRGSTERSGTPGRAPPPAPPSLGCPEPGGGGGGGGGHGGDGARGCSGGAGGWTRGAPWRRPSAAPLRTRSTGSAAAGPPPGPPPRVRAPPRGGPALPRLGAPHSSPFRLGQLRPASSGRGRRRGEVGRAVGVPG